MTDDPKTPKIIVTLKDVGREACVSYQTVSRVINGSPNVDARTRERVMNAARRLGYRPNRLAGSLRTNRTRVLGLVMSDVENVFFAEVVGGVQAEAASRGYSVFLANSAEDVECERQAVIDLIERRVDGLIIAASAGDHGYLKTELPKNFPLVAINRAIDDVRCGAVLTDNETGAETGVRYLIERGHRKIGIIIGSASLMTSRERLAGYQRAMAAAGLEVRPEWIAIGGFQPESGRVAAMKVLTQPDRPTALFASSNRIAEGVLWALPDLGIKRGRDLDLVGFDNSPWARLVDPPLPVVAQPTRQIGRRAVQMLLDTLAEGARAATTVRLSPQFLSNEPSQSIKLT